MTTPNIELVTTAPAWGDAERLLRGDDNVAAGSEPAATAAAAVAPEDRVEKRGRKRKEGERTAGGRLKRSRADKPGRTFGRAEAKTLGAGPSAVVDERPPMTAPVENGPLPAAEVLEAPDPALLEFVKPYGVKLVETFANIGARFAKDEKYKMQEHEGRNIGECLAVVLVLRMPQVALRAPEAALVAAVLDYIARVSAKDDGDAPG